jgi:hypothetical protein
MLKDAEAGEWDKVISIETQRSKLLEKLFSGSHEDNNITEMDNKIRKIIDINNKLEEIAMNARESASNDVASICKGRNALDQYSKNSA